MVGGVSGATTWDGITLPETLKDWAVKERQRVTNAAWSYDWQGLLSLLADHPHCVNATRLGGSSLYAPLHQAAHGGAPASVVEALLERGAWRTLKNARGERPIDVARRLGHEHLYRLLEPVYEREVPHGVLSVIERHFHAVIRGRAPEIVEEHQLRLPELEPLLEMERCKVWFAIPGMYGGFSYELAEDGVEARLVAESWCRVVSGSGQRHVITSAGSELVEKGFV